jgi:hypothetical protein
VTGSLKAAASLHPWLESTGFSACFLIESLKMTTFQKYIVLIGENKIKVTAEKDATEEDRKLSKEYYAGQVVSAETPELAIYQAGVASGLDEADAKMANGSSIVWLGDNLKEIQAWWMDNNGPGEPPELDEENSGLLYFSNSFGLPIKVHIGEAVELQYFLAAEAKKLIK